MASETRRSRLAAWGLSLFLIAVGAAAGVAADRLALSRGDRSGPPRGPPSPEAMTARMTDDLELDEAQARAVRAILEDRRKAMGAVFARVDPEAEAIRSDADARIRALLEPAQRERFDRQVAEHERRRAEVRRRLGGGPPPPPP
jgi:Spy/CpxP family protein refolding chaperone